MELAYFGLKKRPFSSEVPESELFPSFDMRESFTRLNHIKQHRGIFLLTGEPGGGKTSLLRKFVTELNPQVYHHGYTPHASVTRSDFYRQLSHLLGQSSKSRKSDLFLQVQQAILDFYDHQGKVPCLILDECQLMDTLTLREIALITNFEMDSRMPLILILVGQPEFRETLKRAIHEPLAQRVSLSYHMAGLEEGEAELFISHALKTAGRKEPLFTKKACQIIHQLSNGLPRKVGNLCRDSMMAAMSQNLKTIDEQIVMKIKTGI